VLFGGGVVRFFGTAFGTAIGKAGFIGFQLELFGADGADFDRKRHTPHDKTHFVGCIPRLRLGPPGGRRRMFPSDHRQRMGYTRHEVTAPRVAVPAGKPFLALSLQYDALVTVLSFGFACCLVIATVCF